MIAERDKDAIIRIAARYSLTRLLLFGSSVDPERESRDIDLAVEGLPPEDFFRFYGELLFGLSRPVDLIDLSQDTRFNRMIRRDGVPVYDASERAGRS